MSRKKTNIDTFFDNNIDLDNRILYMGSIPSLTDIDEEPGVNYEMAEYVIKGLIILDLAAPNGDKPITIIMNNPGGDEYHGLAIYDAIKACKNSVTIIVFGHAMSMGAWILQAADKRIMAPNSRFMMHYGTLWINSHSKIAHSVVKENIKNNKIMEDIFLEKINTKNPKFTRKQLQEMLNFDTILDAKETVALGLADYILGQENNE